MSDFLVAARHKDGSKKLYSVADVADHIETAAFIKTETGAVASLVSIGGGKISKGRPF